MQGLPSRDVLSVHCVVILCYKGCENQWREAHRVLRVDGVGLGGRLGDCGGGGAKPHGDAKRGAASWCGVLRVEGLGLRVWCFVFGAEGFRGWRFVVSRFIAARGRRARGEWQIAGRDLTLDGRREETPSRARGGPCREPGTHCARPSPRFSIWRLNQLGT